MAAASAHVYVDEAMVGHGQAKRSAEADGLGVFAPSRGLQWGNWLNMAVYAAEAMAGQSGYAKRSAKAEAMGHGVFAPLNEKESLWGQWLDMAVNAAETMGGHGPAKRSVTVEAGGDSMAMPRGEHGLPKRSSNRKGIMIKMSA